jgi:hypothetical protein
MGALSDDSHEGKRFAGAANLAGTFHWELLVPTDRKSWMGGAIDHINATITLTNLRHSMVVTHLAHVWEFLQ